MNYDFNYALAVFLNNVMNRYAAFDGRTSRREFWHYVSIAFIISITLSILSEIPYLGAIFSLLSLLISLALLLPGIGIAIRRMHDIEQSGIMVLIPIYNIYLACQPGTPGTNRFGPEPAKA
ncbi:DUF805 domain-containing protein [Hyphomonas oceanitis]|uniref:Cytochrome n=1 Tax=Hyphomonas oceanitis SCH89 TaxID=1280953 RepID=A0A059G8P5_9PROT|nr:DUF805 domain-containing protein [Hyphomonas oceanitis]KDA03099.1 cytochrome [Hyphomonas oceanitis SCH89]